VSGVAGVRFHDLFWRTLEPHRGQGYYPGLRDKLTWFIQRKVETTDPASGRDNYFGAIKALSGIWHFAISRTPDVVIFYTLDGGHLNLALVGSHHDYPFNGKNLGSSARTAERVHNTIAAGHVPTPGWSTLRWNDPEELLRHPDLPQLSAQALDALTSELVEEMDEGARYRKSKGIPVEDASEEEFDRYFSCLVQVREVVLELRRSRAGMRHWMAPRHDAVSVGIHAGPSRPYLALGA
jgi:hypothetical protein